MITAAELRGVMAMMPAFTTPNGGDLDATDTVAVDKLQQAVNRIIDDGVDVISTTGSFGELHTLLPEERETLARATIEAARKRVPVFVGCTGLNTRDVVRQARMAEQAGAHGILIGVPFYFPSTVPNAVQFFRDIAETFPRLAIMVYHNPTFHNLTLPSDAFQKILESPNIVAMKDSHRDPVAFMKLMAIAKGRLSVFVNQYQIGTYAPLGAVGCWSIDAWLGPWPVLRLRDAIAEGDVETVRSVTLAMSAAMGGRNDLSWRENSSKLATEFAGYCAPGPLRRPFVHVPADVVEYARQSAANWRALCDEYQPAVQAKQRSQLASVG
jgi:dihydrodipicolinate synthase/N-acetylneuraminate lyase